MPTLFILLVSHCLGMIKPAVQHQTRNSLPAGYGMINMACVTINQDKSSLKCTIDGKDWVATTITPDEYPSEIVQIQGRTDKTDLWLQLNEPAAGKTDALIETDLNHYTDEKHNMYMIKSGKTVITKMDDKWIEGTFSFKAQDARSLKRIEVTNGSFRVPNPKSFNH